MFAYFSRLKQDESLFLVSHTASFGVWESLKRWTENIFCLSWFTDISSKLHIQTAPAGWS